MYIITGLFPNRTVRKVFKDVYDAIEYRDILDAHYAKVVWETC